MTGQQSLTPDRGPGPGPSRTVGHSVLLRGFWHVTHKGHRLRSACRAPGSAQSVRCRLLQPCGSECHDPLRHGSTGLRQLTDFGRITLILRLRGSSVQPRGRKPGRWPLSLGIPLLRWWIRKHQPLPAVSLQGKQNMIRCLEVEVENRYWLGMPHLTAEHGHAAVRRAEAFEAIKAATTSKSPPPPHICCGPAQPSQCHQGTVLTLSYHLLIL
ncbi:uncharacterized protein LOC123644368 [Lemur catta]|uniref:uncharacterized protein LOC123644368 n=1 Tax=Lemur catta TaxID=9447 RepID=UPI001E26B705|nr:uncharacterized protein LOC123644368 [Lemur catta]